MSPCPSDEQLQDLLADRLSDPTTDVVEAHLEACDACQQAMEQLTGNAGFGGPQGPGPSTLAEGPSGDFLRRLGNVSSLNVSSLGTS